MLQNSELFSLLSFNWHGLRKWIADVAVNGSRRRWCVGTTKELETLTCAEETKVAMEDALIYDPIWNKSTNFVLSKWVFGMSSTITSLVLQDFEFRVSISPNFFKFWEFKTFSVVLFEFSISNFMNYIGNFDSAYGCGGCKDGVACSCFYDFVLSVLGFYKVDVAEVQCSISDLSRLFRVLRVHDILSRAIEFPYFLFSPPISIWWISNLLSPYIRMATHTIYMRRAYHASSAFPSFKLCSTTPRYSRYRQLYIRHWTIVFQIAAEDTKIIMADKVSMILSKRVYLASYYSIRFCASLGSIFRV